MSSPDVPTNVTRIVVAGYFTDSNDVATAGKLVVTPDFTRGINDAWRRIVMAAPTSMEPSAATGLAYVSVVAGDDPDLNPSNFTHTVSEPGGRKYQIFVSQDTLVWTAGTPGHPLEGQRVLWLNSVAPSDAPSSGVVQVVAGPQGPPGEVSAAQLSAAVAAAKLADRPDLDTTGAAVDRVPAVSAVDGGGVPTGHAYRAVAPVLVEQTAKTSAYTAAGKQLVPMDTSAAAVTVTLPAIPATGDPIYVATRWESGINTATITAPGGDKIGSGTATSTMLAVPGETVTWQGTPGGTAGTGRWRALSSFKPQSSLAALFTPLAASRHARGVVTKLAAATDPFGVLALGDSTTGTVSAGTALTYFYYLSMASLWTRFPAWTVSWITWDHTTQAYLLPTHPQVGTAGDRYLKTLAQSAYLTTPDSAAVSITGDMDVRIKLSLASWTPVTQSALCSKQGGAGQRSWRLELGTNGRPVFSNSADGTVLIDRTATAAVPFTAGQTGWLRATLDVDNTAAGNTVTFYTSTDGATWTQLGAPVITAGTTSVFDSTETVYFPGRTSGGYNDSATNNATFYELQVLSGIGGTPVIVCDLDAMPLVGTTFTDYTGNVWTLNGPGSANEQRGGAPGISVFNGGVSGQVIAYANDSTRGPKMTPYPCDLAFINYSENEGNNVAYRAAYKQLADFLIAKWADCRIVATLQPKRLSPAPNITEHDIRTGQIAALATTADYGIVDVRASYGANVASYLQADGIHPTVTATGGYPPGGQRWADEVYTRHFAPWVTAYGL